MATKIIESGNIKEVAEYIANTKAKIISANHFQVTEQKVIQTQIREVKKINGSIYLSNGRILGPEDKLSKDSYIAMIQLSSRKPRKNKKENEQAE